MQALTLDYLRPALRVRAVRYVLFGISIAFASYLGWYYINLSNEVRQKEARLAKASLFARDVRPDAPLGPVSAEEYVLARDTINRLSTPWGRLFEALEAAQTEQVALISVEPDADSRVVVISGDAKDYLAALSYMASLAEQPSLTRVHLVRHEKKNSPPQKPLSFSISAAWKEKR